jgi:hypothetical protein
VRGETPTLLGPIERANVNQWTAPVKFTIAMKLSETRIIRREIRGKYEIKIVIKHAYS